MLKTQVVTESYWQKEVQRCAEMHGWKWFHQYDSRWSRPGFPDLVLAKDGIVLFIELKSDNNESRIRPDQVEWLEAVTGETVNAEDSRAVAERLFARYEELKHIACVHAMVWRPIDRALVLELLRSGGNANARNSLSTGVDSSVR